MKQTDRAQAAIDYLNKVWPKGNKQRGEAMVLLALAQIAGREEQDIIKEGLCIVCNKNPIAPRGCNRCWDCIESTCDYSEVEND